MSFGTGRPVQSKLYLEGKLVENALISATITGGVNGPSTAEVHLRPSKTIRKIIPRTHVAIFTNDPWAQDSPTEDPFKLVFEGEVVARGFVKRENQRAFVINCKDVSNNWEGPRKWWFDLANANGQSVENILRIVTGNNFQAGSKQSLDVNGLATDSNIMQRLLKTIGEEDNFMKALVAMLEDIGIMNPFYRNVKNRYRITDRVVIRSAGESRKLWQIDKMQGWIDGMVAKSGADKTLLSMVLELLEMVYHEYVSLPVPSLVSANPPQRDAYNNPLTSKEGLLVESDVPEPIVAQFIFKPNTYTLPPPTCNILYPNQYDQAQFVDNFLAETTRLVVRPIFPQNLVGGKPQEAAKTASLLSVISQVLRPTDLELYFDLVKKGKADGQPVSDRTADARFTTQGNDLTGQSPRFTDFDYLTNEERIRGSVYGIIPIMPTPTLFGLVKGKVDADQVIKGSFHQYIQNIASYEYFKEKLVHRSMSTEGPYNPRAVPGFSTLLVDDSDDELNVLGYLMQVQHIIHSTGIATTSYQISYARLVDDIDFNRPRIRKADEDDVTDDLGVVFDTVFDADGQPDFGEMFEGTVEPPTPEWFSNEWKDPLGLDLTYRSMFGESTGGIHSVIPDFNGSVSDAVDAIVAEFKKARQRQDEFNLVSKRTFRSLVDRDAAFRFIGAVDEDVLDKKTLYELRSSLLTGRPRRTYRAAKRVSYPTGGHRLFVFQEADSKVVVDKPDSPQYPTLTSPLTDGPPTYDGRPARYNFEARVFYKSLVEALAAASSSIDTAIDDNLWERILTGDLSTTPQKQAPTGIDELNENGTQDRVPLLAFPLSESDIIRLRRAVIDGYLKELQTRGVRG